MSIFHIFQTPIKINENLAPKEILIKKRGNIYFKYNNAIKVSIRTKVLSHQLQRPDRKKPLIANTGITPKTNHHPIQSAGFEIKVKIKNVQKVRSQTQTQD